MQKAQPSQANNNAPRLMFFSMQRNRFDQFAVSKGACDAGAALLFTAWRKGGGGVWGQVLTVALALLIGLIFVVRVYILSLSDPVQVTLQILLQLLLLTQLLEVSTSFGLLSLFGELSGFAEAYVEKKQKTNQTHKHTQRQTYFHCKQQNAAQNHVHLCPYCFLYNCMLQSQPISALCVFVNLSHWREMYTFERQQHYI